MNFYHIGASAKFEHACKSDSIGGYYWYKRTDHPYSLAQTFNNLNAILGDGATAWYEIENASPLEIHSDLNGIFTLPVKLDSTEIEVRLILQEGLGLTSASDLYLDLPLGASSVQFNPYTVTVIPGPSGVGSGDTVIARFRFSDLNSSYNLSDPYNDNFYVFVEKLMPDFAKLFNKFKVKFQLQAYCQFAPPNGRVNIKEQFLLILNPSCESCKLPLESISSFTNVNCPGCVLPGWNLTSFDLKRKNYGYADDNNNYLPDSYPQVAADPSKIDLKRAMIGDTLRAEMSGFISEGQDFDSLGNRVGYTFATIGFAYDEGQLLFTGPGMKNLEFIGATGTFEHLGNTYNFTIPANAGVYTPDRDNYYISMSDDNMRAFGITDFNAYANGDNMMIYPEFRIIKNLTNNDGTNPYFGIQTVNCFYVMGGEPFTVPLQYPEANDANNNHELDALTGEQRGAYKYWCTAYESRYIGIGYDMTRYSAGAENLTFYWNYMSYKENKPSICNEVISYYHSFLTGKKDLSDYNANMESAFSFPFEIREIGILDTLKFNFPEEYEVDKILFANYNPYYDANQNKTFWAGDVMMLHNNPHGYYRYEYNLANSTVTSNSIEIYPGKYMDEITGYPYKSFPDSSFLWQNGETKLYAVSCFLKPKNCGTIPKYVAYPNRTVEVDYSNIPLDLTDGDSSLTVGVSTSFYGAPYDKFTNAKPVFSFQPLQNYQFTENGEVFWDVAFSTNDQGNPSDNQFARPVEHAFLSFFSPSDKFDTYSIPTFNSYTGSNIDNALNIYLHEGYNYAVNKFDSVYNDINYPDQPIYGVGYLGSAGDPNAVVSKRLRLQAAFDCSALPPGAKDSIGVIMGWNCFDYPSSIEEACYVDTTYLVIEVPDISMNVTETLPSSIESCDTAHFSFLMDVAGIGELNELNINIENKGEGTYQYLQNSGKLQYLSTSAFYEPQLTDSSWVWNLDALSEQLSENDFVFSFDVLTGCQIASDVLDINIYGENFCGKVIVDKDYAWKPNVISGLPQLASLAVSAVNTQSGTNSQFTYTITNNGNAPTGTLNTILLDLPEGFVYSGSDPAIENLGGELLMHIREGLAPGEGYQLSLAINNTNTACEAYTAYSYVNLSAYFYCRAETCAYTLTSDTLTHTIAPESLPQCEIFGSAPDCQNSLQNYTAALGSDLQYSWTLTNVSNASLSGDANSSSVSVQSGSCDVSYTLNLHVVNTQTACSSECSRTFAFTDEIAPVITSQGSDQVLATCTDQPVFTTPQAADNCSQVTIVELSGASVENPDGSTTYTRSWKAIDACGNESATVAQNITVPACVTSGNVYCTLTQGFYGNGKGIACATGERGNVLVQRLLSAPFGNLVIGKPGRMLTITAADAACVIKRLPAGGTAAALPAGNQGFGANCSTTIGLNNQGKFNNVLLGQTITLGLNLRMNAPLGSLLLSGQLTTVAGTAGQDQQCGTADDLPVVGSTLQRNIPASVITALNSIYGSASVNNLFDLANRALGGQTTGGASLADINAAVSAINEGFDGCRFLETSSSYAVQTVYTESSDSHTKLDIYPNPFEESFTIVYPLEGQDQVELLVTDMFGKVIYRSVLDPNRNKHQVNLSQAASGIYLVEIRVNGTVQETTRLLKGK